MSVTHSVITSFQRGQDPPILGTISTTAKGESNHDIPLTSLQTGVKVDISFAVADLKSIYILSTKAVNIRQNANDGTVRINLAANVPYEWYYASGQTTPFPQDITAWYLDNTEAAVASVQIRTTIDA